MSSVNELIDKSAQFWVLMAGASRLPAAGESVPIRLAAIASLGWSVSTQPWDPSWQRGHLQRPRHLAQPRLALRQNRRAFPMVVASALVVAGLAQARSSFSVGRRCEERMADAHIWLGVSGPPSLGASSRLPVDGFECLHD